MSNAKFVVETPDGDVEFSAAGSAADYLLEYGFAKSEREPHWHLRWCLERMTGGESMDVGAARLVREPRDD